VTSSRYCHRRRCDDRAREHYGVDQADHGVPRQGLIRNNAFTLMKVLQTAWRTRV
jgi:hypothetical protein